MRDTCPARLIPLNSLTPITLEEEYKSQRTFVWNYSITLSLLGTNTLLRTLSPNIINVFIS